MKMNYEYDYQKTILMIKSTCFALHEQGKEVSPDEFAEYLQNHHEYEKIPLTKLVKKCYVYFKHRTVYGKDE